MDLTAEMELLQECERKVQDRRLELMSAVRELRHLESEMVKMLVDSGRSDLVKLDKGAIRREYRFTKQ